MGRFLIRTDLPGKRIGRRAADQRNSSSSICSDERGNTQKYFGGGEIGAAVNQNSS